MNILGQFTLTIILLSSNFNIRVYSCSSINVGTRPERRDVVRDGAVASDFRASTDDVVLLGSEHYKSSFYFSTMSSTPIHINAELGYVSPFDGQLMRPTIRFDDGDVVQTSPASAIISTSSTSSLIVTYNCNNVGGSTMLWLKLSCDSSDDDNIYVVWEKYCRSELTRRTGISIGTESARKDVVADGVVQNKWKIDPNVESSAMDTVVMSSVTESTFYVHTTDKSTQVYGQPRFETDQSRLLVMLKEGFDGGIARNDGGNKIVVEYRCDRAASSSVDITMIIDLCFSNVPSAQCDEDSNEMYEPIRVEWVKNCGVLNEGDSFWLSDLVVILCLSGIVFCIFRCYFNYYMKDLRGVDAIPWGRQIEAMFSTSSNFRYVRAVKKNVVGEFGSGGIVIGSARDDGEDDTDLEFVEDDTTTIPSSSYQASNRNGNSIGDDGGLLDETDF